MQVAKKNTTLIHFIIAAVIMFGFRLLPPFGEITPYGMAVLGIFIGMIYGWSMDAEHLSWTSLLGLVAFATTEYGNAGQVLAGAFNNESLILILVSSLFVGMLQGSNVTTHIANKILTVKFAQGKPWVITFLISIAPALCASFITGTLLALIMLPIWEAIFRQAGYKKGDLYPAMVIMGFMIIVAIVASLFPFKGWCLVTVGMAIKAGIEINMAGWMTVMVLTIAITSIGWMLLMMVIPGCNPDKMVNIDITKFALENEKMTAHQKAALLMMLLYVIGAIIVSFAGGSEGIRAYISKIGVYGWTAFIVALAMVVKVDGKAVLDVKEVAAYYYWDLVYVVAAAMLIASQITAPASGIAATLTQVMAPIFSLPDFLMLFLLGAVTFIITNFANNVATTITMITLAMTMATQATFDLQISLFVITVFGIIGLLTPAGSVFGAMIHSHPFTTTKSAYIAGGIMMVYLLIIMGAVMIPLASIFM